MSRAPQYAALTLIAVLGLAGCSSGDPSSEPSSASEAPATDAPATPAAEAAAGDTITGTGYSFAVPEDWGDPGAIEGFDPDSLAADLDDADGFADNVNVILSPAGVVTADQVETAGVTELEDAGAADVTVEPRLTVAGSEAAHLSAMFSSGDVSYAVEQYYLNSDDQTYIVTFSFSPEVADADRAAVSDAVLASWAWE